MTDADVDVGVGVDILVIGAGPAGLYAAYYAGFRALTVAVMDALPEIGGQVSAMYPEKRIFDIAGLPGVLGRELVSNLATQAAQFAPTYLLGERASALRRDGCGRPIVVTDSGLRVRAEAVIITGGIGAFVPRALPVGTEYLGRGLSYFVPSLEVHRDRDVVVVGGGDSAVDWALNLEPLARSVTLVHRRAAFRAHESSVTQLRASRVEIVTDAHVSAVHGADWIDAVELSVAGSTEPRRLPAQSVIAALGFIASLGPLESWGLEFDARHIQVDSTMATNLDRVFAAGDITEYRGKVRLIAVGFGEAATAVNNAATLIRPGAALFPGHSTDVA